MSNKFTQEEYRKIVELHDKRDFSVDGTLDVITYFVHNISRTGDLDIDIALAIANPLTREWAHDKFVKKEKKYYWTIKVKNKKIRLYKGAIDETVKTYVIGRETARGTDEQLTESEVRECGYRLDLFDKEEV